MPERPKRLIGQGIKSGTALACDQRATAGSRLAGDISGEGFPLQAYGHEGASARVAKVFNIFA
jgi:hypothetical protein